MSAIKNFLKGKKTYLVATAAGLTALVAWSEDTISLAQLVTALFEAFGFIFLRLGVAKLKD